MDMQWKPNTTVAAVTCRDGRYLVVEEDTDEGVRYNQPAGHWEAGETLLQAVVRETLEETAHHFAPQGLQGVYTWRHPGKGLTYLRFAFSGVVNGEAELRSLDTGIRRALWLTPDELRRLSAQHRSPLVMRCVDDHLAGRCFPLDLLVDA